MSQTSDSDDESVQDSDGVDELPTMTVEVPLDPARSLMYKRAMEAAGPLVEEYIEQQVVEVVTECYDEREELKQELQERRSQQVARLERQLHGENFRG